MLAFAGVALAVALSVSGTGDYMPAAPVAGDNAGPAMTALVHGNLASLVAHQPLMGLVSLLVRLPFAGVARLAHAGTESVYQLGALACLLPLAAAAAYVVTRPGRMPRARVAIAVAALVALAGPATSDALRVGHPEEILAITLATAAVATAGSGRRVPAAILLGLAVGTKPWALLAVIPFAAALPERRGAALALAAAVAAPFTLILPLADPGAFSRAAAGVGAKHLTDPFSLWWPFGSHVVAHGGVTDRLLPFGLSRSAASLALLALAVLPIGLATLRAGRADARHRVQPLALLALLGLLRCVVDPLPLEYNFIAVLIPLAAWEATADRLPLATLAGAVVIALVTDRLHSSPAVINALSLVGAATLAGFLAREAFRAPRSTRAFLPTTNRMPPLASTGASC
jgi:hypothetical protein